MDRHAAFVGVSFIVHSFMDASHAAFVGVSFIESIHSLMPPMQPYQVSKGAVLSEQRVPFHVLFDQVSKIFGSFIEE